VNGSKLQLQWLGARGQIAARDRRPAREHNQNGAFPRFFSAEIFPTTGFYGKSDGLLHLRGDDAPQFLVWLNKKEMIGRPQSEPLAQTRADGGHGRSQLVRRAEEMSNHMVEGKRGRERRFGRGLADVHSAAATELDPAFALKLAVSGADGIRMKMKTTSEFAGAGEALPGRQIAALNAEHNLGHQLFPEADFRSVRKPELHAAHSNLIRAGGTSLPRGIRLSGVGASVLCFRHRIRAQVSWHRNGLRRIHRVSEKMVIVGMLPEVVVLDAGEQAVWISNAGNLKIEFDSQRCPFSSNVFQAPPGVRVVSGPTRPGINPGSYKYRLSLNDVVLAQGEVLLRGK
jgi:hypothetical protein